MRVRPFVLGFFAVSIFGCDAPMTMRKDAAQQEGAVVGYAETPPAAPAPAEARPGLVGRREMVAATAKSAPPDALPQAPIQSIASTAMVIRSGMAMVEVDSVDSAITRVRTIATRLGGYVADLAVQGGRDQQRTATVQVRLPSSRFDDAVADLSPLGRVESVNVTAQDVGEEYVDISARVANARRLEERLIALLAARTGKLQDALEVERELARVREEIERMEGRMRYLREHASVSTLAITLHERAPIVTEYRTARVLANAFGEAWRNFIGFVAGCIALLGVLVPLSIVFGAIGLVAVRLWRAASRNTASPASGTPAAS